MLFVFVSVETPENSQHKKQKTVEFIIMIHILAFIVELVKRGTKVATQQLWDFISAI